MDGRAGVQPTDTNESVGNDELRGSSASEKPDELRSLPLTIREVVRRGRVDRDEVDRLRAEIDRLRLRAESAEHLLQAQPDRAPTNGTAPIAGNEPAPMDGQAGTDRQSGTDEQAPVDGQAPSDRRREQSPTASGATRWATAAVLPSSRKDRRTP
jgi:hypothetical protein